MKMKKLLDKLGYVPFTCVWEITMACNMQCRHCGSAAGQKREYELTTEQALDLCHQLAELGCKRVTLSGGEPLMRKDWPDIAKELIVRKITVNMISNGWIMDTEKIGLAKDIGLSNIGISLDGVEHTHDYIRNVNGSFQRSVVAFRTMADMNFPSAAITCINKLNLSELEAIYEALLELDVPQWQLQLAEPMGNMTAFHENMIDPEQIKELLAFASSKIKENRMIIHLGDNIGYYSKNEKGLKRFGSSSRLDFWVGCMAGCQAIGIRSNGDITGCLSIRSDDFIEGNVLEEPLRDIWFKEGNFAYNRNFDPSMLEGYCAECQYGDICRAGCRCMSFFAGGSKFVNPYCAYRVEQTCPAQGDYI